MRWGHPVEGGPNPLSHDPSLSNRGGVGAGAALKPTERVRTVRSVLGTIWAARVRSARVPEILGQIRRIE